MYFIFKPLSGFYFQILNASRLPIVVSHMVAIKCLATCSILLGYACSNILTLVLFMLLSNQSM